MLKSVLSYEPLQLKKENIHMKFVWRTILLKGDKINSKKTKTAHKIQIYTLYACFLIPVLKPLVD